jgi:SepF-like predicted cell division protein (DUF552 family)
MENEKFRLITVKDENGNPVRKFVHYDEEVPEPECFVYGDYVVVDEDQIQEAKEEHLKKIFNTIKEVAKDDRFWIVKKGKDNKFIVGWKLDFTQMYTK